MAYDLLLMEVWMLVAGQALEVRPNPAELARPSESGRTQIGDGRPNPAELRFGTAVRIRPKNTL